MDNPQCRNAERNFRGEKRSNATHTCITNPDARLARKSNNTAAIKAYGAHMLMENRYGLIAREMVSHAHGTAERDSAIQLLDRLPPDQVRILGADKGYDTRDFVAALDGRGIAPHIARDTHASKTGRHPFCAVPEALIITAGYFASQRVRKRIEEFFGWTKEVARMRQTRYRRIVRVSAVFALAVTTHTWSGRPGCSRQSPKP